MFTWERSTHPLAAFVFCAFYEKGWDALSEGIGEPNDLGFLETGGGWWLEEEAGDGVPHFIYLGICKVVLIAAVLLF